MFESGDMHEALEKGKLFRVLFEGEVACVREREGGQEIELNKAAGHARPCGSQDQSNGKPQQALSRGET